MRAAYQLETVTRAMRVLECFTHQTPELRLTDLSTRLGMDKAQVLRIASTLESGGFLVRDPETKRYRLGIRLFQLGMVVQQQLDLRRIVHPYLRDLVAETQETARLVVPDPAGPICVDLVESPKGIRVFAQLGMRMPWNAGASPKLILAYLPEEERERILSGGPFPGFTNQTTTDPDELRAELEAIRAAGYHVRGDDLDEGAIGISAPVFDHEGRIAGAINVSGPSSRIDNPEAIGRLVQIVRRAASSASRELGYQPGPTALPASIDSPASAGADRMADLSAKHR